MDKPKGIKVIAILILIFSGLSLLSEIRALLILLGSLFIPFLSSAVDTLVNTLGYSSTSLLIRYFIIALLDILFIIGAIRLLKYKEGGRKMVIYTAIGYLLYEIGDLIYSIVSGVSLLSTILTALSFIVGVILYGLVIFYFSKKKVKEAFA